LLNYIFIIISFLIWSSYGVILNKVSINPIIFTLLTTSIGFILITSYIFVRKVDIALNKKFLPVIFFTTILFLTNAITFFYAYKFTSISNAIFSHYLAPIFVSIFSIFILHEKIEKVTIIALIIAIVGMFFIFLPDENITIQKYDIYGIILGVISAICYGLSVVIAKSVISRINYIVFMFYQGIFTSIFVLAALIFKTDLFNLNFNLFFLIILVGITHSFIAPLLYLKGLQGVKAQFAGLLGYTEVACSILLGIIFLEQIPSFFTLFGGILIVLSGGLVILYGKNT